MKRFAICMCLLLALSATGANATVGLTIGQAEPVLMQRGGRNGVTITFGDGGRAMTAPILPAAVVTPFGVVML